MDTTINIRRIPDLVGVADDMGDLFVPEDWKPGEVLVRRGRIQTNSSGVLEVVFAYDGSCGLDGIRAILNRDGEWHLTMGSSHVPDQMAAAIASVIGKVV